MMVRFTTKKIESLTLGERLKKMRNDRRLGTNDVAKMIKVQVKYLQYLEEGEYAKLPADVYVKGFLRSLAIFFGVSEKALIKQYEREKGIQLSTGKVSLKDESPRIVKYSGFAITPKILIASLVAVAVISGFCYLYLEVNSFVSVPRLVILKPSDGTTVDGNVAHVIGVAEKDAVVSLNGQFVLVNENGEFSEDVTLQNGLNTITVVAKNKFDKESTQSININANIAQPEMLQSENSDNRSEEVDQQPEEQQEQFSVRVNVASKGISVRIEDEKGVLFDGSIDPKLPISLDVRGDIKISSTKGSKTDVRINGKDLGVLSTNTGKVSGVMFNKDGRK